MSLFGGRGESGADRAEKKRQAAQKGHADFNRGTRGNGEVRRSTEGLGASGNVPSILLKPASQVRREAAGQPAGSSRAPSILPQSAAHIRRAAAAKIREQEEAAGIIRRAAETKARQEAEARAAEVARKAAEAARVEQAKRAAEAVQVRRTAFEKDARRVLVVKASIPKAALSATARAVFAHLVIRYTDNGSRPVVLAAADVAFALGLKETAAREALDGLQRLGWVVSVTDAFGAKKLMPAAHAAATVEVEAA